jgi:hypothetical protein
MDPFYLTVGVLVLVGVGMIAPLFTCTRRASCELNLKPLWQKHCTGYLGALGIGIPAIRIALYQDFMVIGFLGPTVISYRDIAEVSVRRKFWSLRRSGVTLKLRGMVSSYHFNLRDPQAFVKLIEPHLTHHSTGTPYGGAR